MSSRESVGTSLGVRISLGFFGILAVGALVVTYVLADSTDRHFAWTVQPPVTAAFLGSGYAAGLFAVLTAFWRGRWAEIRPWMVSFFVFSVVTAAATFIHLDRFHLDESGLPLVAAWGWIAVYIALPIWTLVLLIAVRDEQPDHALGGTEATTRDSRSHEPLPAEPARTTRSTSETERPLSQPAWSPTLVAVLWAQFAIQVAIGVVLFVAPATAELWPWELTPLTARAVAGWLFASATLALVMVRERGPANTVVSAVAYLTLPVVFAISLPRYGAQLDWESPAAIVFVVVLVGVAATGVIALVQSRRHVAARRVA